MGAEEYRRGDDGMGEKIRKGEAGQNCDIPQMAAVNPISNPNQVRRPI